MSTRTAGTTLDAWLDDRRAHVERALARVLPLPPAVPPLLREAMEYSLLGGGKRLRPLLALAAAETVGADALEAQRLALPAACALEMVHTYSLVHDDLPAMDDDSLRRGRPTAHVRYGEGMAILVGDGLLTEAFSLLAREPDARGDAGLLARKLSTLALIAEAAGAGGMVGGQAIDLDAARPFGPSRDEAVPFDADRLRDMHARKTGALIRASVMAGALMAGAPRDAMDAIDRYGREIGLAFQIVDDILDVEGSSADLGKTAGKDAASGKPTYPALFGLETSKRLARDAIERAKAALTAAGLSGYLPLMADRVVARKA